MEKWEKLSRYWNVSFIFSKSPKKPEYIINTTYNIIRVDKKNICNDEVGLYYTENNKNIYLYCLDKVEIIKDKNVYELKDYLKENNMSIEDLSDFLL